MVPTHSIKMKGKMTVFSSIFVTKYRQGLGYFEDEFDGSVTIIQNDGAITLSCMNLHRRVTIYRLIFTTASV